jgi:hypothetical protein
MVRRVWVGERVRVRVRVRQMLKQLNPNLLLVVFVHLQNWIYYTLT